MIGPTRLDYRWQAKADEGFKSLYTGVDLSGWEFSRPASKLDWHPRNWTLRFERDPLLAQISHDHGMSGKSHYQLGTWRRHDLIPRLARQAPARLQETQQLIQFPHRTGLPH